MGVAVTVGRRTRIWSDDRGANRYLLSKDSALFDSNCFMAWSKGRHGCPRHPFGSSHRSGVSCRPLQVLTCLLLLGYCYSYTFPGFGESIPKASSNEQIWCVRLFQLRYF